MVECLVEKPSDLGYHFLIEGTLRTVEISRKTSEIFKK